MGFNSAFKGLKLANLNKE